MSVSVAMLLSNSFRPDPRVYKEARSLAQAGYKVTIICWDRQAELPAHEQMDGFEIRRIAIRSAYKAGSRQIFHLPRFWQSALRELRRLQPDIVHCHDLETTPAGYWYARARHIPWILDAHECYPEQTRMHTNVIIYFLLLWLERFMTRRATQVITVGHLLAQRFRSMGGRVSVVGNYQPLTTQKSGSVVSRADLGLRADDFVVAYIGSFIPSRVIVPLMQATQYCPEAQVLLLGDGPQRSAIEAELLKYPRVRYLGQVPQERVPDYTSLADVIYYGLSAEDRNNHYSCPNALFNALAAGKPLITTNVGEIAHIVQEKQCGVVVEEPTPVILSEAMKKLLDSSIRDRKAENARRAAREEYNWQAAEKILLAEYQRIHETVLSFSH